ncbi:PEGA domain protein [Leptospira wolffii]|uniref:PEGA domain protein n=1 Tax=Leptospira wolffii TaxID=409998 RepID=A0A2M9ZG46_9LEPT|nr:PEGA domain-containing protein [Leptospira wolffii]PJZ67408.1 PEGA domain protein [Leptospira wolffii]
MKSGFLYRLSAGILLIALSPALIGGSLYGIDDYYRFEDIVSPERIVFEKERKLCIFPLRNLSGEASLDFYSPGYASVVYSGLKSLVQIFDESLLPTSIQHGYGNGEGAPISKSKEGEWDSKRFEKLKKGEIVLPATKDPRYINLKIQPYESEAAPDEGFLIPISRKYECFYSISGEYEKKGADEIQVRVRLRSSKDGSKKEFSHKTSVRRSYQELSPLTDEIRKILLGKNTRKLTIKTGSLYDSLVFLDGNYIGKTPLKNVEVLAGIHDVRITKNGFDDWTGQVDLRESAQEIELILAKEKKEGFISVTSEPAGAKVFLGSEFLGTTPLNKIPVKTGWNRLRFSLDEHVDIFKGVEIKKGEVAEVSAKLKPGESVSYYKNKKYLFLDHTYEDFAIYSLYGSLFFYAGYYYFNLRADQALENARPMVSLTNFAAVQELQQTSPNFQYFATVYFYQERIYEDARSKSEYYRSISGRFARHQGVQGGLMLYGIGAMLILSATFYALGLDSETLEVGVAPVKTAPAFVKGIEGQYETESYAKFNYRF